MLTLQREDGGVSVRLIAELLCHLFAHSCCLSSVIVGGVEMLGGKGDEGAGYGGRVKRGEEKKDE